MLLPLEGKSEDRLRYDQRQQAQRQVDVEDPAPSKMIGEEPAQERTADGGDGEDRPHVALVAAAVAWGDDIANRSLRHRNDAAGAQPLHRAGANELQHAVSRARKRRPDEEDDNRELEQQLAPKKVAELAVELGHRRRRGQQVRRDNPGQVLQPAQLADDCRQRGGDDRLVQGGQQHPRA